MSSLKAFGIEEGKGKFHEEAIYSLALVYNIITDAITSYLIDYDLTPGKFNILMAIKHQGREEGIAQGEISKHLIVTPSNMTKMIDKLEAAGLVRRSALEGDRRVNIMRVTAKGEKVLDSVWDGYNKKLKELTEELTLNQQKDLASLLNTWLNRLRGG